MTNTAIALPPCWFDRAVPAYRADGSAAFLTAEGDLIEGIYLNMPNDVYHQLPAISSSQVKKFAESPAHWARAYRSDVKRKRTLAQERTFDTGSLGHELILEPEGFASRYARMPCQVDYPNALAGIKDMTAKAKELGLKGYSGKSKEELAKLLLEADPTLEIWDVILADALTAAGDRQAIDPIVWDDAHRIERTCRAEPRADQLIRDGAPEVAMIARCPTTGEWLKVKFDWLRFDGIAADVKTTRSANPQKFAYQMRDLRYDLQQVFYTYVASLLDVEVTDFAFVAIEFLEADICHVFELSSRKIARAAGEMHTLLAQMSRALALNDFQGYVPRGTITVLDW